MSQNPGYNTSGSLVGGWSVRLESTAYALVSPEGGVILETNIAVPGATVNPTPRPPGNFRTIAGDLAGGWSVRAETSPGKTFATPSTVLLIERASAPPLHPGTARRARIWLA